MDLTDRQQEILAVARSSGRVMVEDLALRFQVTPQTIRKDLNDLCDRQLLARTHGGAVVTSSVENVAYEARRLIADAEKRAIGRAAAALIPDKSSLFINIGTTTEEVAKSLGDRRDLLVITNNLHVAMQLYPNPDMRVIVAGGQVRHSDGAVIGASAIDLIQQFKVDLAIIGASAIDEDGALLDFDYQEVRVSQAIIANARRVVLVSDHLKVGRSAPVRIAHLKQVDVFVTDKMVSSRLAKVCREANVEVIEAGE
ncbi:DeoR family transcriptional regulator [Azorhizobium sp. AG788]|uniref:DeoR/GlpR family DNA-binding transcription regulator n=1 Tax=Azorhizobium sp. AG788 TaxID=2183897 RepID=UPI00105B6B6A|nr:DeoR/GlpR family DNA-binding transcription regulator [Azorhizobium sp. AG788]TDT90237.1 DeoR family transcriptional regulator [Azorhizobium sp. AG788]